MVNRLNSLVVTCYKFMGFAILGGILFGLVTYLGVHAFFYTSSSWAAPIIISATDEEVIRLYGHVAEQQMERERVLADIRNLKVRLSEAKRIVATERRFQDRFMEAIEGDRAFHEGELARLRKILNVSKEVREQIEESNRAYAGMARTRAEQLWQASLVDQEEYLTMNHQLAQMARTNLSLVEAETGLEGRIREIRSRTNAVDAIFRHNGGKSGASVDIVLLEREYLKSVLSIAKAEEEAVALAENLSAAQENLKAYDNLIHSIRSSPRVKAIEGKLTVAFVPYDNLQNATPGAPVYGCSLGIVICEKVGVVSERLDGELTTRHPVRNKILRGVLVQVEFTDPSWAEQDVLHIGGSPLFL